MTMPSVKSSRWRVKSAYFAIWPATLALFAISPFIARGSISLGALRSTLPFAAILAIVSVGQTLIIQQRGLDLSIPGIVSLSAILVTKIPGGVDSKLVRAIVIVLVVAALAGLLNGLVVTLFGVTPLVATLGVNAILLGTILKITSGAQTASASKNLVHFSAGRIFGISNIIWVAILVIAIVTFIVKSTVIGRRFVAIGTSAPAARAAGMSVRLYQAMTYVIAALFGALGGILLAGYLQTPGLSAGNEYLLPSIAAAVLGGTSLAGGGGSVLATAGGALFLTQLQQVVFGAGAPASVQLLIQSIAIALGMGLRRVPWKNLIGKFQTTQTASAT